MSRRYLISLAAGLACCAVLAFVVLPRPRAQAKSTIVNVNVPQLNKGAGAAG